MKVLMSTVKSWIIDDTIIKDSNEKSYYDDTVAAA